MARSDEDHQDQFLREELWGIDADAVDSGQHAGLEAFARMHASYVFENAEDLQRAGWSDEKRALLHRLGWSVAQSALAMSISEVATDAGQASSQQNQFGASFTERLWDSFDLRSHVKLGRGEKAAVAIGNLSRSVHDSLAHQVIAARFVQNRTQEVRDLARSVVRTPDAKSVDFKTSLQELLVKAGLKLPEYTVTSEAGPDHARVFRVQVRDSRGRTAHGEGASKRRASQSAAESFVRTHLSHSLDDVVKGQRPRRLLVDATRNPNGYVTRLPVPTRRAVARLGSLLGVPEAKRHMIAWSLTHPSYLFENKYRLGQGANDQALMAFLGSHIVRLLLIQAFVSTALSMDRCPPVTTRFREQDDALASLLAALDADSGVLLGRGQASHGVSPSIAAQTAQALVGVWALQQDLAGARLEQLPASARSWVLKNVQDAIDDPDAGKGAKTRLQEFAVALGCTTDYAVKRAGPGHASTFFATAELRARDGTVVLRTAPHAGPNKGASEEAAATEIREKLGAVLGPLTRTDVERLATLDVRDVRALWALAAEVVATGLDRSALRTKLFGLGLLESEQLRPWFLRWANDLAPYLPTEIATDALDHHFLQLPAKLTGADLEQELREVRHFVAGLDPENAAVDLRMDPHFSGLKRLLGRLRVLTAAPESRPLQAIAHDSASPLALNLSPQVRDCVVRCRTGAMEVLLETLHDRGVTHLRLDRARLPGLVHLTWTPAMDPFADKEQGTWALLRGFSLPLIAPGQGLLLIRDDQQGGPAGDMGGDPPNPLVRAAARALGDTSVTERQVQVLAAILHDVKNHLVAYNTTMLMSARDATVKTEMRLDALRHRTSALDLVDLAMVTGTAFVAPSFEDVELNEFFGSLCRAEARSLPVNVRLLPPRPCAPRVVTIAARWVTSMIVNLVRNASKALKGVPGDIEVEWLTDGETLMIEVRDSGPGIPEHVVRWLSADVSAVPAGEESSGLGLLSVQTMARRLGGRLQLDRTTAGSVWLIEIPMETSDGTKTSPLG